MTCEDLAAKLSAMSHRRKVEAPQTLGEAIQQERVARGWTQWKLATMIDTRENNVRNWESGRNYPSHPLYAKLCDLFGWPLPYAGRESTRVYLTLRTPLSLVPELGVAPS